MKITISRDALLTALTKAKAVVGKSTMQILGHVLVTAKGDRADFRCTDYETSFAGDYPATVHAEGLTTIPVGALYDMARSLSSGDVTIERRDSWNHVQCGTYKAKVPALDPADFPDVGIGGEREWFTVPKATMADLFNTVSFCTSTEASRPQLQGVLLTVERAGDSIKLTTAATDGHRLGECCASVEGAAVERDHTAIVNSKCIAAFKHAIEGADPNVDVSFHLGTVAFRNDESVVVSRALDETYPAYKGVIPSDLSNRFTFDRAELVAKIKRVANSASAKNTTMVCALSAESLTITVKDAERGESRESVEIDYSGVPMEFALSWRYLVDALSELRGASATISIESDVRPAVVSSDDDHGLTYVVMPVKV